MSHFLWVATPTVKWEVSLATACMQPKQSSNLLCASHTSCLAGAARNMPYIYGTQCRVCNRSCMSVIFIVNSLRLICCSAKCFLVFHLQDFMRTVRSYYLHGGTFTGVSCICPSVSTVVDLAPVRQLPWPPSTLMNCTQYNWKALALLNSSVLVGEKHAQLGWSTVVGTSCLMYIAYTF